jgi:hypothetical protein
MGPSTWEERLVDYLKDTLELVGWVGVEPIRLSPTWSKTCGKTPSAS